MDPKERLIRFKDLLRILAREHTLGESKSSDYRTAVLQESWTLLELLGTIEGFLSDERLGLAGEDVRQFDAAKNVLKAWMNAARNGTLTPQDAQRFSQRVTMIIAKTTETLDQLLTAMDAERQDRNQQARVASQQAQSFGSSLSNYGQRQSVPWYQNMMRVAVLAIAPMIAGCVPGGRASAEEPTNPTIQNPQQERDYVIELEKKAAAVEIPDGKDSFWYVSQGQQAWQQNNLGLAKRYLDKGIGVNKLETAGMIQLAWVYCRMAQELKKEDSSRQTEIRRILQMARETALKAISLYENERMPGMKNKIKALETIGAYCSTTVRILAEQGDKDGAQLFLNRAREYGYNQAEIIKLANELGLK